MRRIVDEHELEHVLDLLAGEVGGHEGAAGGLVEDALAERRGGEDVVDRLHARDALREPGAHHAVGRDDHVGAGGGAVGVGHEVGERRARDDVGEGVGHVL